MMTHLLAGLLLALGLLRPAVSHEFLLDGLLIVHPAIPATSLHATSAPIHMILSNTGSETERLLAIETPAGTVSFQKPVTLDDGGVRQESVSGIEILPGEVAALLPGQTRGMLEGLNQPLFEGSNIPGVLVFERRGRFEMFFMIDPLPDLDDTAKSASGPPAAERARDLWEVNQVMRQTLQDSDDLVIAPVVIVDDVAVAGWSRGDLGARTLLRRDVEAGWYIELWSGSSLMLPTSLTRMGVRGKRSEALRAEVRAAEAALGATFTRRFDAFPGTAFIGKPTAAVNFQP